MQSLDAHRFGTYRAKIEWPATFSCILPLGIQNTRFTAACVRLCGRMRSYNIKHAKKARNENSFRAQHSKSDSMVRVFTYAKMP